MRRTVRRRSALFARGWIESVWAFGYKKPQFLIKPGSSGCEITNRHWLCSMASSKSGNIHSMTGFARADGFDESFRWTWELKSVNARNLDLRLRLPPGHDNIEVRARKDIAKLFVRGNVSVHLNLTRGVQRPRIRANREILAEYLAVLDELGSGADVAPSSAAALLSLPGVLEPTEDGEGHDAADARANAMIATLNTALVGLVDARTSEGAKLEEIVGGHLSEIETLCQAAGDLAATQPKALQSRLTERLAELFDGETRVAEDRLVQEVALLAAKADVREELDRLAAHVTEARTLIKEGSPVGRKLDFLCQELNREVNTLCSKTSDLELTRVGLDLKTAVDRLREQIQNIE